MKRSIIILAAVLLTATVSCQDYFLQKPTGTDTTAADVFSSKQNAMYAIATAYSQAFNVNHNMKGSNDGNNGNLGAIAGEVNGWKYNWDNDWHISHDGMNAQNTGYQIDNFAYNYKVIRHCYNVIENIDLVPDMTDEEKNYVKGEMYGLIAFRYCRMLIGYGGVPIVDGFVDFDNAKIGRSSVEDVLNYVIDLCDNKAMPNLPNAWPKDDYARLTKGAALAIKAQALLYCARPLFNTDKPYLDLGENNNLICMGKPSDNGLWEKARDASKAVIDWCAANNVKMVNTGSPFDDYSMAVSPGSTEMIVVWEHCPRSSQYDPREHGCAQNNMSWTQMQHYMKADGTEQHWTDFESESEFFTNMDEYFSMLEEMEPRYWADAVPGGYNARNNDGESQWTAGNMTPYGDWDGGRRNVEQCGRRTKFWYHAGTRKWINLPIYRLAYFYLAYAECCNELGETQKALDAVNVTHLRAGLPALTMTNKDELRKAIQREWAVEFYLENNRLFDVKHWKHPDIGNGIIGGVKKGFYFKYIASANGSVSKDAYEGWRLCTSYTAFWADNQFLNPFPVGEVNKGYIVQNPGY